MVPRFHDPDTSAGLTRHQWLQDTLALVAAGLTGSQVLRAVTQDPVGLLDVFTASLQALTVRPVLDRDAGVRLLATLDKSSADFAAQSWPLAQALAVGSLSDAQQEITLQILKTWYLGMVDGSVVICKQTLMYSVASDMLVMCMYCPNQPGLWAELPVERQA